MLPIRILAILFLLPLLSGCAPLLIAGGAVGGYAIAKNADTGDSGSIKKK